VARADEQETVVLRALASGGRQEILERLAAGPATSAMLARSMSSNTGVTSYHLRVLGKAGLIVPGEQRGRERYWRLSHADVRFQDPSRSSDPNRSQATIDLIMARLGRAVHAYLDRDDLPDTWRDAALFSQSSVALNESDLAAFTREYLALLGRWTSRRPRRATRAIRVAFFAFPDDAGHETESS
jgi:DNA-binding transcriptional ArsR family regulator